MISRQDDIWKRLVIAHQHIETRPKPLDQVGFQQQCFSLGPGDHELHRRGFPDHANDSVGVTAPLRVVGDPFLETPCLPDVKQWNYPYPPNREEKDLILRHIWIKKG